MAAIHIFYGHSKRKAEQSEKCFYCGKHFKVMAYTYFGAPLCQPCWDNDWRKTEDGICDPPFNEINHPVSGVWIGLEPVYADKLTPTIIKARRKELGLSQLNVAQLMGIARTNYINIENGHRKRLLEWEQNALRKALGL